MASFDGLPPNTGGWQVSVSPTLPMPVVFGVDAGSSGPAAGNGWMTGFCSWMNEANAEVRMYTPGRWRLPHFASLTSGPQLVMPICTGPCGVWRMNGPPLSPAHAWMNGACLLWRSSPQISEAMIARG